MSTEFDPYHKWLGIPPAEQPANHYRLLGIALFESDPDVIDAAASKQSAYIHGCATGPHVALSQKLLSEIAAARLCLLNPAKRATYDASLRASTGQKQAPEVEAPPISPTGFEFEAPSSIGRRPNSQKKKKRSWQPSAGIAAVIVLCIGIGGYLLSGGNKNGGIQSEQDKLNDVTKPPKQGNGEVTREKKPPTPKPTLPLVAEAAINSPIPPPEAKPPTPSVEEKQVEAKVESCEQVEEGLRQSFSHAKSSDDYGLVAKERTSIGGSSYCGRAKQELAKTVAAFAIKAARKADDNELANRATLQFIDVQEPLSDLLKEKAKERLNGGDEAASIVAPQSDQTSTPTVAAKDDAHPVTERPAVGGSLTIVIWNQHNGNNWNNAGTDTCNLLLLSKTGHIVWRRDGIVVPWVPSQDTSVTIPVKVPPNSVSRVRVEITRGHGMGGLAEVQVFRGGQNGTTRRASSDNLAEHL